MTTRLAIIPARGGSKRIKNKNIKKLLGKPLIQYSLDACIKSKLFDKIHVSTDSKKIFKVVKKNKLNIDFYRPKKLSGNTTPIKKVVVNILKHFQKNGEIYDEAWLIYATNPMINEKILKAFSKKFNAMKKKKEYKILIGVDEYNHPVEEALNLNKKNFLEPYFKKKFSIPTNKLSKKYFDAGMISVYPMKIFLKNNSLKFTPFFLTKNQSIDINDIEDFKYAKKMISKLKTLR